MRMHLPLRIDTVLGESDCVIDRSFLLGSARHPPPSQLRWFVASISPVFSPQPTLSIARASPQLAVLILLP